MPSTGPLLLWLGIQLGPLLLAVLRIPLAARYPEPAEQLAPHLVLASQVVAAGMLFPLLLRNWRDAMTLVATAVPFQLAAGFLGGLSVREMLPAAGFVGGWIVVLATGRACLRSPRAELGGVALASCLTLGAGVLRYLRLEFAPSETSAAFERASPLLTTLAAVEGNPTAAGWILLAALLLAAGAMLVVRRVVPSGTRRAAHAR